MSLWHFSRWHFNPWTVFYPGLLLPSESNFPQSMHWVLLASVWPNKSAEADVHGAQQVLSNNCFQTANCFCCLSQNAMVCLAHCRQELQQKSWKNCKTFSSRPRPRPNVQDQDQDFMIQDQDQDFQFCPWGASRPRPWSRWLHHWFKLNERCTIRIGTSQFDDEEE